MTMCLLEAEWQCGKNQALEFFLWSWTNYITSLSSIYFTTKIKCRIVLKPSKVLRWCLKGWRGDLTWNNEVPPSNSTRELHLGLFYYWLDSQERFNLTKKKKKDSMTKKYLKTTDLPSFYNLIYLVSKVTKN